MLIAFSPWLPLHAAKFQMRGFHFPTVPFNYLLDGRVTSGGSRLYPLLMVS